MRTDHPLSAESVERKGWDTKCFLRSALSLNVLPEAEAWIKLHGNGSTMFWTRPAHLLQRLWLWKPVAPNVSLFFFVFLSLCHVLPKGCLDRWVMAERKSPLPKKTWPGIPLLQGKVDFLDGSGERRGGKGRMRGVSRGMEGGHDGGGGLFVLGKPWMLQRWEAQRLMSSAVGDESAYKDLPTNDFHSKSRA